MASTRSIPGPRGKPIVGMIPQMMGDMLGMFMDITHAHGGIVQFKLFSKPYILVTDPPIRQTHFAGSLSQFHPRQKRGNGARITGRWFAPHRWRILAKATQTDTAGIPPSAPPRFGGDHDRKHFEPPGKLVKG